MPSRPATPFFKGEQAEQPKVSVQDSYTPTAGSTFREGNAASERAHTD